MSFANTQLPVRLPVFKDKVMYISPNKNKNKIEQSYVISASFKGILRLSPNNYNTIYENNPVELTATQDAAISSSYSDAIVFDDDALSDTKTNADIRQRMIIGSDSDGYLVDFRISAMDVEFDNLGVIGITKANDLTIYSSARASEKDAFILGNTVMPSLANKLDSNRTTLLQLLNEDITQGITDYPENYDEIQIDIRGEGDKSYLMHGTTDAEGRRTFEYKRSQQFIRDVIMETLLSFQSVPTGSIHWLPVTYHQYQVLVNKGNQYPNHYYRKDNQSLDTDEAADPIIRDYLLCDGRRYKSDEFPELAKILWKENIQYWNARGKLQQHENGSQTKSTDDDNNTTIKYDNYFRVPDLRAKFISYCYSSSVMNSLDDEAFVAQKYKSEDWNKTGLYTPDNSPKYPQGQNKEPGEHFHFLAYGTYNGYNFHSGLTNDFYYFEGYRLPDLQNKDVNGRIWYLQTTAAGMSESDGIGGYCYGFGASGDRRRDQSSHDVITACAFASAPNGGVSNYQLRPTLGLTSKSQMTYQIPANNQETYITTEYEIMDNEYNLLDKNTYNVPEETEDDTLPYRYGYENAPKYYAFLPLIRI